MYLIQINVYFSSLYPFEKECDLRKGEYKVETDKRYSNKTELIKYQIPRNRDSNNFSNSYNCFQICESKPLLVNIATATDKISDSKELRNQ